eukprot:SAG31_NODE_1541_length_7951_cov_263.159959_4_plen_198_part_00
MYSSVLRYDLYAVPDESVRPLRFHPGREPSQEELSELARCWHGLPHLPGAAASLTSLRRCVSVVGCTGPQQLSLMAAWRKSGLEWDLQVQLHASSEDSESASDRRSADENNQKTLASAALAISRELGVQHDEVLVISDDTDALKFSAAAGLRTGLCGGPRWGGSRSAFFDFAGADLESLAENIAPPTRAQWSCHIDT